MVPSRRRHDSMHQGMVAVSDRQQAMSKRAWPCTQHSKHPDHIRQVFQRHPAASPELAETPEAGTDGAPDTLSWGRCKIPDQDDLDLEKLEESRQFATQEQQVRVWWPSLNRRRSSWQASFTRHYVRSKVYICIVPFVKPAPARKGPSVLLCFLFGGFYISVRSFSFFLLFAFVKVLTLLSMSLFVQAMWRVLATYI